MAGIYIHVPFCKKRCIYCDFFTRTDLSYKKKYTDAICKEITLRKDYIKKESVKSIYFGGGTPSLLKNNDFEQVFETISSCFEIVSDAEITLEANPDDLSEEYINTLISLPFNRISIGIQSFNDQELKFLNRRHSSDKAIHAVKQCKELGFNNISIDLIYGIPGQTRHIWESNLDTAISLNVQHISAYHLIYEEGTPLYRLLKKGNILPVDEELSVDMFSTMIDKLSDAGFIHYEISNFAKEGYYSRHNSSYWQGEKYLGIGAAAHSFDGESRAWNISSINEYIQGVENNSLKFETENLDNHTRYNDFILTGMRTIWGVDLNKLEERFGSDLMNYCLKNVNKYIRQGLVVNAGDILKLTKEGIFLSDSIMSDLMYVK